MIDCKLPNCVTWHGRSNNVCIVIDSDFTNPDQCIITYCLALMPRWHCPFASLTLQELVEPNHLSLNRLRSNGKVKVVPDKESVRDLLPWSQQQQSWPHEVRCPCGQGKVASMVRTMLKLQSQSQAAHQSICWWGWWKKVLLYGGFETWRKPTGPDADLVLPVSVKESPKAYIFLKEPPKDQLQQ